MACGAEFAMNGPTKFKRMMIKITTTKKFTTLMTE